MSSDEKFVQAIFDELFEKNLAQYMAALNKPRNADSDSYARARNALAKLEDTDRTQVFNFLELVIADTASVIFGTLDGVHYPDNFTGELVVSCDEEPIQGDLMDSFIEKAQSRGVYT